MVPKKDATVVEDMTITPQGVRFVVVHINDDGMWYRIGEDPTVRCIPRSRFRESVGDHN